ncbi:MAG: hypothetical protein BWK79_03885 [Beggiatoa sp. IS2]|nr:MAG: hypothetical protein BWK79_03885 [Beggiatoa sp. IS2]
MTSSQKHFTQAETLWDLERLYKDLATVKGNTLTKMEKTHLCGLLCGHSPHEIAEQLHKSVRGVEAFMCKTLYQYIKHLSKHDEERMRNHRDISQWLAELGYKLPKITDSSSNSQTSPLDGLIQILNSSVHILNSSVHIENIDPIKNKMIVLNILRVEIPCPLESSKNNDPANGFTHDSPEEEKK